ncbi:MAG: rhodanese-like domain-containing protein [Acidimicrobiales bacterium]
MPITINRSELRRRLAAGDQLVEVLPEAEYTEEHIPGAVNLPLRRLTAETARRLDPHRPVIVYCWVAL